MEKETKNLKECMRKNCNVEQSSVTILSEMEAIHKRISASKEVTARDVSEMRKVSKKVADFKMKSENVECMVKKCMAEYAALVESNMKKTAAKLDNAAALMEKYLAQGPEKTSKPKTPKPKTPKTS
jgi:spore germination cell wall hydrolase CwlJ-like protein